ncbi:Zinc/iron permease [Chytridium lagenaria]|nr:Zinc/iron permease [Chytridium lagenaria]
MLAIPANVASPLTLFAGMGLCWLLVTVTGMISPEVEHLHPHDNESDPHTHPSPSHPRNSATTVNEEVDLEKSIVPAKTTNQLTKTEAKRLVRLSLATAVALGFHNIPEGVATFISAIKSPSLGVTVAIAIGIHNIPEGIGVAIPVYYATKSKLKALLWSSIAAIAEPLGALIAYIFIKTSEAASHDAEEEQQESTTTLSPIGFALAFGLVGGIMVYIALLELLVSAHRQKFAGITEGKINAAFVGGW